MKICLTSARFSAAVQKVHRHQSIQEMMDKVGRLKYPNKKWAGFDVNNTMKSLTDNSQHSNGDSNNLDMSMSEEKILIGPEYQAIVPKGLCFYDDALPYDNEDKLLWEPGSLGPRQLEDFLRKAGCGPSTDDELALYVLLQAGHDPDEALRRLRVPLVSHPFTSLPLLSSEECARFEEGLATFGKDFRLIQLCHVRTRSIGELVQFYYLWKKSERFDLFAHHDKLVDCKRKKSENSKNYKRKDKTPLNPNVTDYMGAFMDQDMQLITNSTVRLCLINGEQVHVKEEPIIKQEAIDE